MFYLFENNLLGKQYDNEIMWNFMFNNSNKYLLNNYHVSEPVFDHSDYILQFLI